MPEQKWWLLIDRKRFDPPTPLKTVNSETGEINEYTGGLSGLLDDHEDFQIKLGNIAAALGPDVLKRWEDGLPVDLAGEIAELRNVASASDSRDA